MPLTTLTASRLLIKKGLTESAYKLNTIQGLLNTQFLKRLHLLYSGCQGLLQAQHQGKDLSCSC